MQSRQPPSHERILGRLAVTGGLLLSVLAAHGWWHEQGSGPPPPPASDGDAAPDFSASIVVRTEGAEGFRPPSAAELAAARQAMAADLMALAGPVERIPTTSGVGFTLGMHGASAAMYWPREDGAPGLSCRDVSASAVGRIDGEER